MATEDIQIGKLAIPVEADLGKFQKQARQELKDIARTAAREAGREAGQQLAEKVEQAFRTRMSRAQGAAAQTGRKAGEAVAERLERAYRTRMARAKLDLHAGAIDHESYQKRATEAAETFNRSLIREVNRLRAGGILSAARLQELTSQFKATGRKAGQELAAGIQEGAAEAEGGIRQLTNWVKGFLLLELSQVLGRALQGGINYLRGARDAAVATAQSYLRLGAASKLYNVEQALLNELAQRGRREMHLQAAVANDLATNAAKIAGRAGEAARAQELWAAAMDLGAANGLKANDVALALDQSYRGMDEGLNRLGLSDPGQLFKEFAAEAGKSADALSDAEKQQAIMNAIVQAGAKVQGEYGRQLEGDIGRLNAWDMTLRKARETIGGALLPVLVNLTERLEGPLAGAVRLATALLEGMLSPTERLARQLEQLGAASEYILPVTLQDRIRDTKREMADLQGEIKGLREGRFVESRGWGEFGLSELQDLSRDLNRRYLEASAGRTNEIPGQLQLALRTVDELIAKEKALDEARKNLTATEREYQDAAGRRDLRFELDAVNDRIGAIGEETALTQTLVAELDRLYEKRAKLEKQLGINQPPPPEPTEPARELTAAEKRKLEAAKKAAREAQEEMATALAGLTATARDEALLALERLERDAVEKFRAIGQRLPEAMAEGFARRREALGAAADLEGFARELDTLSEAEANPHTNAELDRFVGRLQEYIAAHEDANGALAEGTALREQYNDLLKKSGQQLQQNRKAIREEADEQAKAEKKLRDERRRADEERLRNLRDQARTLEENARGALQLAEAFGMIGSEAAQSLQAVAQLAAAVARLAGGDLTALPSALGAVAVIGKQVFGESPAEKARQEVIERNTEALKRLEASLSGFEMTGRVLTTASERLGIILGGPKGTQRDAINLLLGGAARGQQWAKDELAMFEALAREFGIQLFDDEGRPIVQAWEQLQRAVEMATERLTQFNDTLADARTLQDARRNIFDEETTPQAAIESEFALLNQFAPQLLESLGLGNVDLSVPEEVEAAIRKIFEAIESGAIPAEVLDRLPDGVRTLLEMILNVEGSLDELAETTESVTRAMSANEAPLFDLALRKREAAYGALGAGGGSLPIPRPTDLGGQLPPQMVDALRSVSSQGPWQPSHIQALLDRSDPAPIVEELSRVRVAIERRPRDGAINLSVSVPREAVPAGGWSERELAEQVSQVVVTVLRDDPRAQVYMRRAAGEPY